MDTIGEKTNSVLRNVKITICRNLQLHINSITVRLGKQIMNKHALGE